MNELENSYSKPERLLHDSPGQLSGEKNLINTLKGQYHMTLFDIFAAVFAAIVVYYLVKKKLGK